MALRRSEQIDALFRSFLSLKDMDECYAYFDDLCTVKEIASFAQRLQVAQLLSRGCSYQRAAEETGVSSATIGRVKRCLDYGTGGYRMMIKRIEEGGKTDEEQQPEER